MIQVFSREWFEQHQDRLLRFANTGYGRRVLRVQGSRSSVGQRRITKIEPHAIHWANGDGTTTAEYRTHDKYAKRLYHAFKPLWYGAHTWDMVVANNLARRLNLGFDTLTAYPEPGLGTQTVDGTVWRQVDEPGETFSTIRSSGGTSTATDTLLTYLQASNTTNQFRYLFRSMMTFDTSSIPAGATVSSATLSVMPAFLDRFDGLGQTPVHITKVTPNQNNRVSVADYQRFSTTSYASINYASINDGLYNVFTLNSSGLTNVTPGGVSAFGMRLGWDMAGSFTGTWSAGSLTYVRWVDADAGGTSNDPMLTVTYGGVPQAGGIGGTLLLGGSVNAGATHQASIGGSLLLSGGFTVTKDPEPVVGKDYVYRVYDAAGTYLGIWTDVASDPTWSQRLNTPGTTTTVRLARSANRVVEKRDTLTDAGGDPYVDQAGNPYVEVSQTANTIGPSTDVDQGYRVDIYLHYGGFEQLVNETGDIYVDSAGDAYVVSTGAPLGRRVFSGFILDYEATYEDREYLDVTVASNGFELSKELIKSGTTTTVTFSDQAHDNIIKSILDTNPGRMTYAAGTIDATGSTATVKAELNTKLEGIEATFAQTPPGWSWYGNVAENNIYLKNMAATADHVLQLGYHIKSLVPKYSNELIRNTIYVVGGDTGSGILYRKYVDAASVATYGTRIYRVTDRRITTAPQAQLVATKILARYAQPIYTTTVAVLAERYDIEDIQLGEMIGFSGAGNFIDNLVLQVVNRDYSPHILKLALGELAERQADLIAGVTGDLQNEQFQGIPTIPS